MPSTTGVWTGCVSVVGVLSSAGHQGTWPLPLDARSHPYPGCDDHESLQPLPNVPRGAKMPLVENPRPREISPLLSQEGFGPARVWPPPGSQPWFSAGLSPVGHFCSSWCELLCIHPGERRAAITLPSLRALGPSQLEAPPLRSWPAAPGPGGLLLPGGQPARGPLRDSCPPSAVLGCGEAWAQRSGLLSSLSRN